MLLWLCVLSILLLSWCLGTVLKALLKSIVVRNVLKAGFAALRLSRIVCIMYVRRVHVEWLGVRPCWAGEGWIFGVMFCRTNFSSILDGVEISDIGLQEVCSVGGLLDFRMGTIVAGFLDVEILLCMIEKLTM